MSIERLYKQTVRVYREPAAVEARDEWGHVELKPYPIGPAPTGRNAWADQGWRGALEDDGPGEEQGARRRWFLARSVDVRERDVLEVTGGPEAGLLLRVNSVTPCTNPHRVHHIEVNVEVWDGDLGAEVES